MVPRLEMTGQGGHRIDVTGYVRTNKSYFHSLYTFVIACDGFLSAVRSTQASFVSHARAGRNLLLGYLVQDSLKY
ncbi:MAG: hypothetical protein JO331_09290 [Verrucomicrobia bacterium]|nr:hypothetical protein [Verrucomicrobiota bacterium]